MNPKTTLTLLSALLIVPLAIGPLAGEASSHHRQGPPFEQMDADGDGFVSEAEFTTFRAERMQQRAAEGRPMRHAENAPTFADIDADGDGRLTEGELKAMHEKRMAQRQGQGMGQGKGHGGQHGKGHGGRGMASFDEIDANGDGCIDRDELNAHHAQRHGGNGSGSGQDEVRP